MASELAESVMGNMRRPFGARVLDALIPSLVASVGSALLVGWVGLKVVETRLADVVTQQHANTDSIEALKIGYAGLSVGQGEYAKRLDQALGTLSEISRKLDDRITYLERQRLEARNR